MSIMKSIENKISGQRTVIEEIKHENSKHSRSMMNWSYSEQLENYVTTVT